MAYASLAKGVAFVLVTAGALYVLLARSPRLAQALALSTEPEAPERRAWLRQPLLLFVLLALVMLGAMALALRYTAARHIDAAREVVAAFGELKARQLEVWLHEQAIAADSFRRAHYPRAAATRLARVNDRAAKIELHGWLEENAAQLGAAAAFVVDTAGREIAGAGEPQPPDPALAARIAAVMRDDAPALHVLDRRAGEPPRVFIDYIVPWRAEPGADRVIGALVVRHDAARFLFPLLQSWPTSSDSAETLLVRRDGDDVLFLNDLRHRAGAASTLRRPLGDPRLAAAQFLRGEDDPPRRLDYRGVEVLPFGRHIAGTDWLLVAKIDRDEALAPVRADAVLYGTLMLGLTLLAALGTIALWRQQAALTGLRERALRAERDALGKHLTLLSRHANDVILLLDETGRIVRANDRANEAYGKRAALGTSALDLRAPSAKGGFSDAFARTLRLGSAIFETTHRHGDGREFPVEISARCIETPEGKFVQAIIRDLTERRSAERALAESEARFRVIVEQSISGFYVVQDGRFAYVNPRFVSIFGYASPDEIVGRIPDDLIVPRDRALVAANIERRLAGEVKSIAYTFAGLRKDGSEIELGVHGSLATFDGRPAIIGTLQDISERARLERERAELLGRMQGQLEAVAALASSRALMEGEVEDFAREMTEAAAKATGAERANAWLFNAGATELRCVDLYEAAPARHSSGAVLAEAQYRNEFDALKNARFVDADDALADPRTAGYVEGYLRPLGITSMLDAVVRVGGRHIGLLCLEHVGRAHHWERDEVGFACQLADQLALAVVQRERKRAIEGLQASTTQLRKANRAMRTLSAGNETLVRATDEATLLRDMCSVIVQAGGYKFAIVIYLTPGEGQPLTPQASAGVALEEFLAIPVPRAEQTRALAALGVAVRRGKPELFHDPAIDPAFATWREFIVRHGIAVGVGLPLLDRLSASPFGVLFIAAEDADAFDAEALKLLAEMANDLAFGIGILRLREEQKASAAVLRKSLEDTILAIAATAEMRDPYTAGHERRVAELAAAIAREMGLAQPAIEGIRFGAMIHDLGKIKIPAEILVKPARLSPIEYELIKQHSQAGYDILKGIDFPWPVARMVLQHHERLDGSGYPNGLKGDAICQEARILSVADTVEAMSSHRPYRPGLGADKALAEIERGRGAQYDPVAVNACLRLFREKGYTLPA